MTELEERLRTAFQARAGEIAPEAPPLELQPARQRSGSVASRGGDRPWPPRRRRWLAPAAAAVAVAAVVILSLVISDVGPAAPKPPKLPPAVAPIQTSVPPYYVALTSVRPMPLRIPQAWPVLTTATVRDTSTGAVVAAIVPPQPYTTFINVSGAADDRTFVLAAEYPVDRREGLYDDGFFLLRINPTAADPAGRVSLTPLPAAALPSHDRVQSMALSPNGRRLATVAMHFGLHEASMYLRVDDLATGRSRIWPGVGAQQVYVPGGKGGLTWTQDSKFLAFSTGPQSGQLRLLNVTARGDQVTRDSRPFAAPGGSTAGYWVTDMTPDGETIFVEYATSGRTYGAPVWDNLARFSVRTGSLTSINKLTVIGHGRRYAGYNSAAVIGPDDVLWTSYDGSEIVVADVRPGAPNAGVYSGSQYTPIPWPANVVGAAW